MYAVILTQQENVSENPEVTFVISIENPESILINDVQTYSVQEKQRHKRNSFNKFRHNACV